MTIFYCCKYSPWTYKNARRAIVTIVLTSIYVNTFLDKSLPTPHHKSLAPPQQIGAIVDTVLSILGHTLSILWIITVWSWHRPDSALAILVSIWFAIKLGGNLRHRRRPPTAQVAVPAKRIPPFASPRKRNFKAGFKKFLWTVNFLIASTLLFKTLLLYTSDHAPAGATATVELLGRFHVPWAVNLYIAVVLGTITAGTSAYLSWQSIERRRNRAGDRGETKHTMEKWAKRLTFLAFGLFITLTIGLPVLESSWLFSSLN